MFSKPPADPRCDEKRRIVVKYIASLFVSAVTSSVPLLASADDRQEPPPEQPTQPQEQEDREYVHPVLGLIPDTLAGAGQIERRNDHEREARQGVVIIRQPQIGAIPLTNFIGTFKRELAIARPIQANITTILGELFALQSEQATFFPLNPYGRMVMYTEPLGITPALGSYMSDLKQQLCNSLVGGKFDPTIISRLVEAGVVGQEIYDLNNPFEAVGRFQGIVGQQGVELDPIYVGLPFPSQAQLRKGEKGWRQMNDSTLIGMLVADGFDVSVAVCRSDETLERIAATYEECSGSRLAIVRLTPHSMVATSGSGDEGR